MTRSQPSGPSRLTRPLALLAVSAALRGGTRLRRQLRRRWLRRSSARAAAAAPAAAGAAAAPGGSTGGSGGSGGSSTGGTGGGSGGRTGGSGGTGRQHQRRHGRQRRHRRRHDRRRGEGLGRRRRATRPRPTRGGGDTGSANADPGERFSLREQLAGLWTGTRKTTLMEGEMQVFRGQYLAGQIGGPNGHTPRLRLKPGKEYIFEYKLRFDPGFDFSRGGKIPGLAGASAPTGCVNTDGSGFSARNMWRQNGAFIGYVYDNNQSSACGTGLSTGFNFAVGRWYDMKQRVKLNTGRNSNGILELWVDGKMVLSRSNLPT